MKKILIVLFSFIYLLPAIGFSMDLHWCGKSVQIVSINESHITKCPCGTDMPAGCCKDLHLSVKLIDSQYCSKCSFISKSGDFKQHSWCVNLTLGNPLTHIEAFDFTRYHAPPFKSKLPFYLANNVIRI